MRISDWSSDVCSSDLGGGVVRAVPAPRAGERSRKFFDDMNDWARGEGHAGLGYINIKGGEAGGPIAKNHGEEGTAKLIAALGLGLDDGVFFAAGKEQDAAKVAEIGRASCRERVCKYMYISVDAVSIKKKTKKQLKAK